MPGNYEKFAVRPGEFRRVRRQDRRRRTCWAPMSPRLTRKPPSAPAIARTPVAEALGAVNTLWRQDGRLWGDNTDVAGFLANMDEAAPGWAEPRKLAVVIGAGGAARAIVYALISRGFERVAVVNRTQARAEALAAHFGGSTHSAALGGSGDANCLKPTCSSTQARLAWSGSRRSRSMSALLPQRAVVADAVYVPLRTPLIEAARARGLRIVEGLGMLLHQAAPAFARWFGRRPVVTPELRALVEAEVIATLRGGAVIVVGADGLDRDGEIDRRGHVRRAWRSDIRRR